MNNMQMPFFHGPPHITINIEEEIIKLKQEINILKEKIKKLETKTKNDYMQKDDNLYMM